VNWKGPCINGNAPYRHVYHLLSSHDNIMHEYELK